MDKIHAQATSAVSDGSFRSTIVRLRQTPPFLVAIVPIMLNKNKNPALLLLVAEEFPLNLPRSSSC
jgi:hypothetical protein